MWLPVDAYLDIETTGLSRHCHVITVIGIYRCDGNNGQFVQLVGNEVTRNNLVTALEDVRTVYTYNGSRFDLPFIRSHLDIDLATDLDHQDLMYACWKQNLKGGFKAVERQLGIHRHLQGIDGYEAVLLWCRYKNYGDRRALDLLLEYNKEDVVNLKLLRHRLTW